jgi:isopentenyl phosphate kinase
VLCFLKLGGSLITDKHTPHSPRMDVLAQLAQEISTSLTKNPDLHLLIGHGSGSFGHVPAAKFGTRQGVRSSSDWLGFQEVWKEARALNQIVIETLCSANIPVLAFPPSCSITTENRQIIHWDIAPLSQAIEHHLVPVINGDVVFDIQRGGTILSTEDLFIHLAPLLFPDLILLAGKEEGVWEDFPQRTKVISSITPHNYSAVSNKVKGSVSIDVTGGMADKVYRMLQLIEQMQGLKIRIFSGEVHRNLSRALMDESLGTLIHDMEDS